MFMYCQQHKNVTGGWCSATCVSKETAEAAPVQPVDATAPDLEYHPYIDDTIPYIDRPRISSPISILHRSASPLPTAYLMHDAWFFSALTSTRRQEQQCRSTRLTHLRTYYVVCLHSCLYKQASSMMARGEISMAEWPPLLNSQPNIPNFVFLIVSLTAPIRH